MRTTLTLDADVAADLKRQVRQSGKPFREVLNDAVRRGLRAKDAPARAPYRLKPVSLGGVLPGVDLDRALRLADALEDETTARELEMRK
jgi:hypothetical protein